MQMSFKFTGPDHHYQRHTHSLQLEARPRRDRLALHASDFETYLSFHPRKSSAGGMLRKGNDAVFPPFVLARSPPITIVSTNK